MLFEERVLQLVRYESKAFCHKEFARMTAELKPKELLVQMASFNTYAYTQRPADATGVWRHLYEDHKHHLVKGEYGAILEGYRVAFQPGVWRKEEDMERALAYIEEHLDETVSLGSVAEHVYLSKNYLCKRFHEYTGMRFCHYVNDRRIAKARVLLLDTEYPLDQIAQEVGFKSQAHFSTTFKKHTGLTPLRFRRLGE